jgi:hypothetical protein
MRASTILHEAYGLHETEPVDGPAGGNPGRFAPRLETIRPITSRLTSRDYTLLEAHLWRLLEFDRPAPGEQLLTRLIRTKLADAVVVLSDDIEPTIATGNSRVTFRIDGGPAECRRLVHWDGPDAAGQSLRIPTFLGVAVLGLAEGQRAPLLRADGSIGSVALDAVTCQPEARRRAARSGEGRVHADG